MTSKDDGLICSYIYSIRHLRCLHNSGDGTENFQSVGPWLKSLFGQNIFFKGRDQGSSVLSAQDTLKVASPETAEEKIILSGILESYCHSVLTVPS